MSQSSTSPSAGAPPSAAAPALLERHEAGLRTYLTGLPGAEAARVEVVIRDVMAEGIKQLAVEDDPAVWLFAEGRRRTVSAGHRGDVLMADEIDGAQDEELVAGEDPAIAVHRAFERLTVKQQEALRLKFQFGFDLAELARITGVSYGGAAGLMHSALMRLCQASGAALSLGAEWLRNVRLTAYALDEMEAEEKTAFIESVPDGKGLLESSDAIRKTGAQLTRVLESGEPLPKRRRRRKGAAGWRSLRGLLVIGAMVAGAALLAWYLASRPGETAKPRGEILSGMNGSFATATRARRAEADSSERSGGRPDADGTMARNGRTLRPGEADWEKKHFGRGRPREADEENSETETPAAQAGGEVGPTAKEGGARSPGAASGPRQDGAPAAMNRGESGTTESAGPEDPVPAQAADEAAAPSAESNAAENSAAPATGMKAGAREMKPAKPDAANQGKAAPGRGAEGGKARIASPPTPGATGMWRDLAKKKWPKPSEVRVAEMLKQAPLDETVSDVPADEPLAARVEMARSPWKPEKLLVRVAIKAKQPPVPARPPANLVFAIDVSHSMAGPNRLPLVQEGIRLLAQRLRPEDRVAVVTYAARAKEVLPGIPLGGNALELRQCLGQLEAAGQTNGYEGLQLAYAAARRKRVESGLNVVVLCTDGNFNLGETNEQVLAGIAAQAATEGIKLTVFGFGRSDRNDLRLELLAAKGGGRSCYVNTREEAERLLATQIDGLFEATAEEVALTVKFNPERVEAVRRIDGGTDAATSAAVTELLPGRSLDALYEVSLKPGREDAADNLAQLGVSYRLPGLPARHARSFPIEDAVQEWTDTDPGFRFAAAGAELGRILEGERAQAGGDLDRLESWVRRHLPEDEGGYRSELLSNLAAARLAAASNL